MKKLRKFLRKRWVVLVILFLLFLGVRSRFGTPKNTTIERYTVVKQDLKRTLTLSGVIDAQKKTTLHFLSSGRLVWIGIAEGDTVGAYQAIAALDKRDVQKNLEKKLQSYLKTRWDFEQLSDDNEGKILDDRLKRILEKSQFDLNTAVLDVELQDLAVEYATLITPIAGIATKVTPPVAGVNITPATLEFEIVDPASLYLSVSADQTEVIQLAQGTKTLITFDAFPGQHVEGTVERIAFTPTQGEIGTVYTIWVSFPYEKNAHTAYRLGMTADVEFSLSEKPDALAVPTSLIRLENDKTYINKQSRGRVQKVEVALGEEFDTMTEVLSGLSEGDVIHD